MTIQSLRRWIIRSAITGAILWLAALALLITRLPALDSLEVLLLLTQAVIAPLAIRLIAADRPATEFVWLLALAALIQPFAALASLVVFLTPPGPTWGLLGLIWAIVTGLLALHGIVRLFAPGRRSLDEICLSAALIYMPIGAGWLLASRLEIPLLGFGPQVVALTALHFHYIPLAALFLTGLAGHVLRARRGWRVYHIAVVPALIAPILVAIGITASPLLEFIGAAILVAALLIVALLVLWIVTPAITPTSAKVLLGISHGSLMLAMAVAAAYAYGEVSGAYLIAIPDMVRFHGWINAIAFGLLGIVGWSLVPSNAPSEPPYDLPPSFQPFIDLAHVIDHKVYAGRTALRFFLAGLLTCQPRWMLWLFDVRALFVRLLGMRQQFVPLPHYDSSADVPFTPGQPAFFFTVRVAEEDRCWLADVRDRHLDAAVGVIAEPMGEGQTRFHVLTLVHYNEWRGPFYLTAIWPFHHLVIGALARAGLAWKEGSR